MSLRQDVSSLNITISQKKSFAKAGFYAVQDLHNKNSSIDLAKLTNAPETKSALECLKDDQSKKSIQTFIQNLDSFLDGIIKDGSITELVGLPGSGRTQLCLHLSIAGQVTGKGVCGEIIYICTNLNFTISRLREIAENYINKCPIFKNCKTDDLLKRIHHVSINTFEEFSTCLRYLDEFLKEHSSITLVVVDSITYPLRQVDSNDKTIMIYSTIKRLRYLANIYKFCVVVTNDMTTVAGVDNNIVPALRDTFYHIINNRIKLSKKTDTFHAEIVKSSDVSPAECDYELFDQTLR